MQRNINMKVSLSKPVVVEADEALDYARKQAAKISASDRPQDVKNAALDNLKHLYPNL